MSSHASQAFFVAGGTVPTWSAAYVTREADRELMAGLVRGEFCYVLTSRQMGKSSLMARTAVRLREQGILAVVTDLTSVGNDLDREQWYYSLAMVMAERLGMRQALKDLWVRHTDLTPLQRWTEALRFALRQHSEQRMVIFIDEIDTLLALPFKASEFFAGIRSCYNRRSEEDEFGRLTFCLLGVADPSDLINDQRLTPFNIGRRITLDDFSADEASALAPGLGGNRTQGQTAMARVLYWTGGHPYLTQRLCQAVVDSGEMLDQTLIDRQCEALFLTSRAREQDDNLTFVRDRLLGSVADGRDVVSLLRTYERVRSHRRVSDRKPDRVAGILRLSGLVRSVGGLLTVRNRIYSTVFDREWVRAHLPDSELRRERAAQRLQIFRIAGLSAAVVMAVGYLALSAYRYKGLAVASEERAKDLLYVLNVSRTDQAFSNGEYGKVVELLEAEAPRQGEPDRRGFEWRYYWRLMHGDNHTFSHEGDIVRSVAFASDSRSLASSSGDGSIKVWDIAGGRAARSLPGHHGVVESITFGPRGGGMLASGGWDGAITLWDSATGRILRTLTAGLDGVASVALSRNGRWLACGGRRGQVHLWDMKSTKQQEPKLSRQRLHGLHGLAFTPGGDLVIGGSDDGEVAVWNTPDLRLISKARTESLRDDVVTLGMALSPDGKVAAVGRRDGGVVLLSVPALRPTALPRTHNRLVNGLAFSPDGRYLATASWDNTVDIRDWRNRSSAPVRLVGHTNRVTSVAFSRDGKWLASGGSNEVKLWDYRRPNRMPRRLAGLPGATGSRRVTEITFGAGSRALGVVADTRAGMVSVWDGSVLAETPLCHTPGACSAVCAPGGDRIAIGTVGRGVRVIDPGLQSGSKTFHVEPTEPNWGIGAVALSPDGQTLAAARDDPAVVTIWNIRSGARLAAFQHTNMAAGIAFSPDGKMLAAANWQGDVYEWDIATRKRTRWRAHTTPVNDVAYSPDGLTLATASDDGSIKLWNRATQREMITLRAFDVPVKHIAFSPDGVVLAASDGVRCIEFRTDGGSQPPPARR